MSTVEQAKMTREQIGHILRRHKGSQADVARKARVTRQTVNGWLAGRVTSANIAKCAELMASECLEIDKVKDRHA
jgi:hypothetical protein